MRIITEVYVHVMTKTNQQYLPVACVGHLLLDCTIAVNQTWYLELLDLNFPLPLPLATSVSFSSFFDFPTNTMTNTKASILGSNRKLWIWVGLIVCGYK